MDSVNRRSGILLDEDYNVYGDQKETDDELSKAALAGMISIYFSVLLLSTFLLYIEVSQTSLYPELLGHYVNHSTLTIIILNISLYETKISFLWINYVGQLCQTDILVSCKLEDPLKFVFLFCMTIMF